MTFQYHNYPQEPKGPPSPLPNPFILTAAPDCDIWKKPPAQEVFSGPICSRTLPLSTFKRARVTVSAKWRTKYDQGGLCLVMPANKQLPRKWIKTGIEVYNGTPYVSTVACDQWADWSLWPLNGGTATIEIEREIDKDGARTSTLWVYIVEGQRRTPMREITWVFGGGDGQETGDCWVGVYTAKPNRDEDDGNRHLQVEFEGLKIETF